MMSLQVATPQVPALVAGGESCAQKPALEQWMYSRFLWWEQPSPHPTVTLEAAVVIPGDATPTPGHSRLDQGSP